MIYVISEIDHRSKLTVIFIANDQINSRTKYREVVFYHLTAEIEL